MKHCINICATALLCAIASGCTGSSLSRMEKKIIASADSRGVMRVLTIEDMADSLILRRPCADFSSGDLESMFKDSLSPAARLVSQLVSTVTDPSQDGVGIAGPQVGLSRRIVAVQRFDKEGQPFEVYPNIRIVRYGEGHRTGSEGCLSIPDRSGMVERSDSIVIEYAKKSAPQHSAKNSAQYSTKDSEQEDSAPKSAPEGSAQYSTKDSTQPYIYVQEAVGGFTAVIFQHECDHLDGILYIDRLVQQNEL